MIRRREIAVTPRNGSKLIVGIIARISGCQNQKELSLDDQVDHGKEVAREYYDGSFDFRIISTKGKGERLDRPELADLDRRIKNNEFDMLIIEDVGRLVRGPEAHRLIGLAVDHKTRVISPNDYIDTAEDSWSEDVLYACTEHMKYNAHSSRRIKHKKMNRFVKFGGATPCQTYGYLKPSDAKTYADWSKDEEAEPYLQEGFSLLQKTLNGEAVSEYFNDNGVLPGPFCRNKKWDGRMVLRLYRNPILKGQPQRGSRHTIKHNETGKRISVPNPEGPVCRDEPHLAFFAPVEFDKLQMDIQKKNSMYRRKNDANGVDSRHRVPKKRTRSFGQHAHCWYCGAHYVWGGNGITDNLMCSNSRNWKCWNSVGFNGPRAAKKLVDVITERLTLIDGFDQQFREIVQQVKEGGTGGMAAREKELKKNESQFLREKENVKSAIKEGKIPDILRDEMITELTELENRIAVERISLEHSKKNTIDIPDSPQQLREILQAELENLAIDSFEFGSLIRELVPEMQVYLVRLCDGGHLLPRARIRLNLMGSIKDSAVVPELQELMTQELTLDLFEAPQRERIRLEAVRLEAEGFEQREIAQKIEEQPTQAAVFNALALHRKMLSLGLSTPYLLLEEPPEDYKKLRRHKNKKYKFTPVPGYERSSL